MIWLQSVTNGQHLLIKGKVSMLFTVNNLELFLDFYVVEGQLRNTLIGRTGMEKIWLDWKQLLKLG